jgi:curved DNA-binding protein CbpA
MNLRKCYELLEIEPGASPEEVRRAYREMMAVWHPDRFAGNPRLRQRAEEKVKAINAAYEQIRSGGSSKSPSAGEPSGRNQRPENTPDSVEIVVEAGTTLVLTAGYHLYRHLRRWFKG